MATKEVLIKQRERKLLRQLQITPAQLQEIRRQQLAFAQALAQGRGLTVKLSDDGFALIISDGNPPDLLVPIQFQNLS